MAPGGSEHPSRETHTAFFPARPAGKHVRISRQLKINGATARVTGLAKSHVLLG